MAYPTRLCYRQAGYGGQSETAARFNASHLLSRCAHIFERVRELQAESARQKRVTVESIIGELENARQLACDNKQASAMVSASTAKARILGLEVSLTEVGQPGDFNAVHTKEELAELYISEVNPQAIVSEPMRIVVLPEIERHTQQSSPSSMGSTQQVGP